MWWIIVLAIIAGLVVLGILILSIPFDLAFQLEVHGKPIFHVKWAWFFGLLKREIKTGKRAPKKKPARRRFQLRKTLEGIRRASEFLQIKGLWHQLIKFSKKVFRRIKIRNLEADFLVGLDDPSESFYLFALTEPFNRLWNYYQPYPINIRTSFIEPVFEGDIQGEIRIYPIQMVPPLMQFVFSRPILRIIRKLISARWKRNR